jgi:hypothetical protein
MAKKEKRRIVLTEGSKYSIKSLGSRDHMIESSGTFLGYTTIGSEEAVCMELDNSHKGMKGKVRVIPVHMVVAIDIVTEAKQKEPKRPEAPPEAPQYFG